MASYTRNYKIKRKGFWSHSSLEKHFSHVSSLPNSFTLRTINANSQNIREDSTAKLQQCVQHYERNPRNLNLINFLTR